MSDPSVKVAYVLEEFPKLSESFIIEEIKALNDRGSITGVLSISRPRDLSDRYPELVSLTRYPRGARVVWGNCTQMFSVWYWKWLLRTLRFYPWKVLAFFRSVAFLPILRDWGPTHLHVHFATFASFMTMSLSERTGIPYSLTIHATGIFQERKMITGKCRNAAFVVAISRFNRTYLKENFDVPEEKVNIVHCGILPSRFEAIAGVRENAKRLLREGGKHDAEEEVNGKSKVKGDAGGDGNTGKAGGEKGSRGDGGKPEWRILSIGRLVEKKGFHILLEALEILKTSDAWTMVIAGDGPLRADLERTLAGKGLDGRVTLLGKVSGERLMEELGKADLFVLPCVKSSNGDMDGIPVVLMEALMCGIPTISTRISGIPELIVHGETGLLVEAGAARELAEAIRSLMGHGTKASELVKNGMHKVRTEFDIHKTSEELLRLFERFQEEGEVVGTNEEKS